MIALPLIAFIAMIFYALMGYIGARNEAAQVYERISMGDRRDLDHSTLLLVRVVLVAAFIAGAVLFFPATHMAVQVVTVVVLAVLAYGTFTPVHRHTFNSERANHVLYLSPGNAYDTRFLRRYVKPWPLYLRNKFAQYYSGSETIREQVHAAGRMAYVVEIAAITIAWVLIIITQLTAP